MKTTLMVIVTLLLVSGCASQTAYKPARGLGYGYSETHLGEDRYRVQFKLRGSSRAKAKDYALLRAAELTLLNGYDWFIVVDRETLVHRDNTNVQTSVSNGTIVRQDCGLLTCSTTAYPAPNTTVGTYTDSQREVETILEIRLGKGIRPAGGDSYDAIEVRDSLNGKQA